MAIQTRREGESVIVSVTGRLDAVTAPEYGRIIGELVDSGTTRVVADFDGLTYMSSAGLGQLLVGANRIKEKGGRFHLANVHKNVVSVFEMCGVASLLDVRASVADALAAQA